MLIVYISACFISYHHYSILYDLSQNQNGRRQVQNEVIEVSPNECYDAAAKGIVMKTNDSYAAVCFSENPPEYVDITL